LLKLITLNGGKRVYIEKGRKLGIKKIRRSFYFIIITIIVKKISYLIFFKELMCVLVDGTLKKRGKKAKKLASRRALSLSLSDQMLTKTWIVIKKAFLLDF
jgi:hypothetical protein